MSPTTIADPRFPQSGALLGVVEGLCGAEKVGVKWP